jgi:archaellum biogenesis ATPase FlaH
MGAKIKSVTTFEAWMLARTAAGYFPEPAHLRTCSAPTGALVEFLMSINPKERHLSLMQNLDKHAAQQLAEVDADGLPPLPGERQYDIVPARDLDKLPPVQWLIDKEIPERGLTVLFGESGVGKSFVALDYALRVAQQHSVIYIPTEGEAGYLKRVKAWCKFHHKSEGKLNFLFGFFSLLDRELLERLVLDLAYIKPKMIVVDTLAIAMAGGDENSTRDMSVVTSSSRHLSRMTGTAVVLVHHIGRNNSHERGSTALRGNADTMIRVNPADDLISIECSKTKDEAPFETRFMKLINVDIDGTGSSLVPIAATQVIRTADDPLTGNQYKLLEALSLEANRDGCTIRELGEFCGIPYTTAVRTLSNLLKFGYVDKPRGSYAITNHGRIKIGLDPLDPPKTTSDPPLDPPNLADDPLDPRKSQKIFNLSKKSGGSSGSSGSSLKNADQDRIKPGSSPDQADQEMDHLFDETLLNDVFADGNSYYKGGY